MFFNRLTFLASEQNKAQFNNSVIQPVIAAAGKEMGKTVEDLLAHGADPNTLERSAYNVILNPQNSRYSFAESLLDVIQQKLKSFRDWKEPLMGRPKKPENSIFAQQIPLKV